jgi:hypothetical protein
MFKRNSLALVVILGFALGSILAGCGGSAGLRSAETTTAGRNIDEAVKIDLGSPVLPVVPGVVTVADSVRAFVPPASLPLYEKQAAHPLSTEAMQQLADRLGLSDVVFASRGFHNATYGVEFPGGDEPTCFTLTMREPNKEYTILIEQGRGDEIPPLPSDEEAEHMADEQLEKVGLNEGLTGISVSIQDAIVTGVGSNELTYNLSKSVAYQSTLDGFPLLGPGAKIYVTIGPRGEVVRMAHWVLPSVKGQDISLRHVSAALDDIAAGRGLPPGRITPETATEIAVTAVSLAYWAEPLPMHEEYYKPVYVFTVVDKEGTSGEWIVPAFDAAAE